MPDGQSAHQQSCKYTITLNGSQWSVAQYGIVEFLRRHPYWRTTMGIVAGLSGVGLIASLSGLSGKMHLTGIPFIILTPLLFWLATVSGRDFELVFPAAEATKAREKAEETFEKSANSDDALKLDFSRLNEYYVINQNQARSSFRWAIFSMFVGLTTIIAGIWFFYLRTSVPNTFMASLSTAAGISVNIIGALFLRLHSQTQERSFVYYGRLAELQKLSLAIRMVTEHQDENKQSDARNLVILQLISPEAELPPALKSKTGTLSVGA
jgi:hypothetical protein